MKKKHRVGILFGGKSAEHDISIKSASAIFNHLDRNKYLPSLIYINRDGCWSFIEEQCFIEKKCQQKISHSFIPWLNSEPMKEESIDIYFPVLHGPNGEDGKIQSLFELSSIPFVGANSLGSALAMDKVLSKTLFQKAGLKTPEFLYFTENNPDKILQLVESQLGYPVFVKPASLGSSVGISKARGKRELKIAVKEAFSYENKIIVEKAINAREIEVAVLGNHDIQVSKPGELIPHNDFYDYEDKYLSNKTQFKIPVKLKKSLEKKIRDMAIRAFKSHFLNGMSRIDFFIESQTEQIYINEINTIPGFTEISMFPKLWEIEGIPFRDLVTKLIELGFEHHLKSK